MEPLVRIKPGVKVVAVFSRCVSKTFWPVQVRPHHHVLLMEPRVFQLPSRAEPPRLLAAFAQLVHAALRGCLVVRGWVGAGKKGEILLSFRCFLKSLLSQG